MGDKKEGAAKGFVDNYFPTKKQHQHNSICDVLDQFIPPNSIQDHSSSSMNQGPADGRPKSKHGKNVDTRRNGSSAVIVCNTDSDPSLMSLGVNYGARDYYPCPPTSSQNTGNSHYEKQMDKKDAKDYTAPENSNGEWWQGSYNY